MSRARQLSLQLVKTRRKGGGRTRREFLWDGKPTAPHEARPQFAKATNVHVTLRTLPVVGRLRTRDVYTACRRAQRVVLARDGFRIVHYSIQHNHVHLLIEADSTREMTNGVRAFRISMTKQINRILERESGAVFADRYHARVITTPTQMRNAIQYVLNNWRHHREARGSFARLVVDPYSSGAEFRGWSELPAGRRFWRADGFEPPYLAEPRTWLARIGWQRGGPISAYAIPGGAP